MCFLLSYKRWGIVLIKTRGESNRGDNCMGHKYHIVSVSKYCISDCRTFFRDSESAKLSIALDAKDVCEASSVLCSPWATISNRP